MALKDPIENRSTLHWNTPDAPPELVQPINLGGETIKVDLAGGQAVTVEVPPWAYLINSEVNLHAKASGGQSLYGLRGLSAANGRYAQMLDSGDMSGYSGFDLGTGDFAVEALLGGFQDGVGSGGGTFSLEAKSGGTRVGRLWAEWDMTVANGLRINLRLVDNADTAFLSGAIVLQDIDPTKLVHVDVSIRRSSAGNPVGMVARVNGVVRFNGSTSDNDTDLAVDFSTGDEFRATIGSTPGGGADYEGDIYFIRAYKRELSDAQSQARAMVAQSSNSRVIDAAYGDMFFEIDFQDQANWADPAQPESSDLTDIDPSYTKIVFNDGNLVAGDVQLADGGDAATESSTPIAMNTPTRVIVPSRYLSLLAYPGSSGSVWLTPL